MTDGTFIEECLGCLHRIRDNSARYIILFLARGRERHLPTGTHITVENIGDSIARLLTRVVGENDCGDVRVLDPCFDVDLASSTVNRVRDHAAERNEEH